MRPGDAFGNTVAQIASYAIESDVFLGSPHHKQCAYADGLCRGPQAEINKTIIHKWKKPILLFGFAEIRATACS